MPLERLELVGGSLNFWDIYREVDLVLDTFPYPGGYMTALALYFGVPVVTLQGDSYGSRFGAAILKAAGREEWIAGDVDEYVKSAVELGRKPAMLSQERERLFRDIADSALLDMFSYVRQVEEGFLQLWKRCNYTR